MLGQEVLEERTFSWEKLETGWWMIGYNGEDKFLETLEVFIWSSITSKGLLELSFFSTIVSIWMSFLLEFSIVPWSFKMYMNGLSFASFEKKDFKKQVSWKQKQFQSSLQVRFHDPPLKIWAHNVWVYSRTLNQPGFLNRLGWDRAISGWGSFAVGCCWGLRGLIKARKKNWLWDSF